MITIKNETKSELYLFIRSERGDEPYKIKSGEFKDEND